MMELSWAAAEKNIAKAHEEEMNAQEECVKFKTNAEASISTLKVSITEMEDLIFEAKTAVAEAETLKGRSGGNK